MPKLKCDIDYTDFNRMIKDLNKLDSTEVNIGVDDSPRDDDPTLTNQDIAVFLEKGTRGVNGKGGMPPRPFMLKGAVLLSKEIDTESLRVVQNTLKGKATVVNKYLDKIGEQGVDSVQLAIDQQGFTKLAPSTIKIKRDKGSRYPTKTHLDTGELYEAINYKIK